MDCTVRGVANSRTRLSAFPCLGSGAPVRLVGQVLSFPRLGVFSRDRLVTAWSHSLGSPLGASAEVT